MCSEVINSGPDYDFFFSTIFSLLKYEAQKHFGLSLPFVCLIHVSGGSGEECAGMS